MFGIAVGRVTALLLVVVVAAACAAPGNPPGAGTPCGGSHVWPPNGYRPSPAGLSVELVSGTTVRVRNDTSHPWVVRVSAWEDAGCVGYLSAEAPRRDLAAGASLDATVGDPGWGSPLRIGVEVWDHPCGDACQDDPTGFGYVDAPAQATPS